MVTSRSGGKTTSPCVAALDMAEPTADASERSECLLANFGLDCISSAAASSAAVGAAARFSPASAVVKQ